MQKYMIFNSFHHLNPLKMADLRFKRQVGH